MKRFLICILACMLFALYLASPLLAAEVVRPNAVPLKDSDVYTDILAAYGYQNGTMEQYKKNTKKTEMEFITAAEYGYTGLSSDTDIYRLYVYIYNPSGTALERSGNKIALATSFSDQANEDIVAASAIAYENMDLEFVNTSSKKGYENTLYKFRVTKDGMDKLRKGIAYGNSRRYDISMITINDSSITVGNSLICTGYAGHDGYAKTWKDLQTEHLEVTPAVYRHMTDSNVNTQVNSVYFKVPEKYWTQNSGKDIYDLTEIKADWNEKRTTPILVTIDKDLYEEYAGMGVLGKNVSDIDPQPERGLYAGPGSPLLYYNVKWHFNPYDGDMFPRPSENSQLFELYWMFYRKKDSTGNPKVEAIKDAKITSAEMVEWYKKHPEWHDKMLTDDITNIKPEERHGTIIKKVNTISIPGRDANGFQQWWENLFGYGYDYSNISDVPPIQYLTAGDWLEKKDLETETLSKAYLISEEEIPAFKKAMDEMVQHNKDNPDDVRRMVVFHFAISKYESYSATILANGDVGTLGARRPFEGAAYMAAEDVFLDFQIVHMTFSAGEVDRITVPTVMSPIDIISGAEPPAMADGIMTIVNRGLQSMWDKLNAWLEEMKEQLGRVVAIVLGLVLLVVCWPLITAVLRFLASILRGVGRGANRLMDAVKRRRNKHKKE